MNKLLLKKILRDRRINYTELSTMTGISRHTINMYLNEKTTIKPEREALILEALGITQEEMKEMENSGQVIFHERSRYRTFNNTDDTIRELNDKVRTLELQLKLANEKLELFDRMLRLLESK